MSSDERINRYSDDESDCDNSMKSVISTWAIESNINYLSISKLSLAIRENIPLYRCCQIHERFWKL